VVQAGTADLEVLGQRVADAFRDLAPFTVVDHRPGPGTGPSRLLPEEVIDAYERLLAADGRVKDEADVRVGASLAALTERGMAHIQPRSPADPPWLRPAPLDLALHGVLAGHQHRLARDQELLLDGIGA
jgi:hypothetical protein